MSISGVHSGSRNVGVRWVTLRMCVESTAVVNLIPVVGVFPVVKIFCRQGISYHQEFSSRLRYFRSGCNIPNTTRSLHRGIFANLARRLVQCDRPFLCTFTQCVSVYELVGSFQGGIFVHD